MDDNMTLFDEDRLSSEDELSLFETTRELAEAAKSTAKDFSGSNSMTPEDIERIYADNVRKVVKTAPPAFFVKKHPFGGFEYIPIAILDPLAEALDPDTKNEILREGSIANGCYCVVRLYFNGKTYDGIGAAEFQTSKGAAPTDFTKLITGALVMGVPKARSEALKNAYSQIGDLFGRGLRRSHHVTAQQMDNSTLLRQARIDEKIKKISGEK